MPWISFDAQDRPAVEAACVEWLSTLARQPGQLGSELCSAVEAPRLGTRVRVAVDSRFVAFLRENANVLFREGGADQE